MTFDDEIYMTIIGVIITTLGFAILAFSLVHDFNLEVHKGAILQPTFFSAIGIVLLICGLMMLIFTAFRRRPM